MLWPTLLFVAVAAASGWLHVATDLLDSRLPWVVELQQQTADLWSPPPLFFLIVTPFAGFVLALYTHASSFATPMQDGLARWAAYAAWVFPVYACVQSCIELATT